MTYNHPSPADQRKVRTEMIVQMQKMLREAGYGRAMVRFQARKLVDQALAAERQKDGNTEDINTQQLAN